MSTLSRLAVTALAVACCAHAHAQSYPAKPVRLIVGFAPGGGTDILARALGAKLTEFWGQQVVVENRPGATGTIGADFVAKAPADGYTLLLGSVNSNAIAPSIFAKLPYDPLKDFAGVAYVGYNINTLVVHPSIPARTVQELIALARSKPGQLTSASAGLGSTQHLALEMFKLSAKVDIIHVPYKGSGQAILDLVGGNVSMNFDVMPPVIEHIRQGRLRALAVTTLKRSSQLPDIPTMSESGLKGFEMSNWYAVFGPANTPRDIVAKLNADFNRALQDPAVRKRLTDAGTEVGGATPEWLDGYVRTEVVKYAKLVKDARVQID